MKKYFLLFVFFSSLEVFSQHPADTISVKEIRASLSYLASDELKGRVNFTKEQLIAATFLGKKFKEFGLLPYPGLRNYFQAFAPSSEKEQFIKYDLKWNQKKLHHNSFLNLTGSLIIENKTFKDYKLIKAGSVLLADSILLQHWNDTTDILVWLNKTFNPGDTLISGNVLLPGNTPQKDILIVAAPDEPVDIELSTNEDFTDNVIYNVIGILPGSTKAAEAIIFSAHYDHVDANPTGTRTGIFNGANDNASGTTAVLELAKYFSMKGDNKRTIIFCLFAGEELGLLGSQQFVLNSNPKDIKTVINIEMIGVTTRTGKNAFFITGSKFSDLKEIFEKNLKENEVKIHKEGFDIKKLFHRSDNYPFFIKGIPAHSIMSSDDFDACYHQPCDDVGRINFDNMARIIKAIATGCKTIISGEETPKLR